MMRRLALLTTICLSLAICLAGDASAQTPSKPAPANELTVKQGRIAEKYAKLEQLMLKMAELDGGSNPQRAALLRDAVQQSKDKLTKSQLESIVKLLEERKLKRAVDGQVDVTADLKKLLELLLSENRADRNKAEQDRAKEYLQEVERLIRLHQQVQGRTDRDDPPQQIAPEQQKVAERTEQLAKQIEQDHQPKEGEKPTPPTTDKPPPNDKPGSEMPPMPPGEAAPPMPPGDPTQQRLQAAQQKMRQAQKKLEESQRKEAQEAQAEARKELEQAKAQLEEILRQLREEEIERTLTQLEARFRKMLQMQLVVFEATERLASTDPKARTSAFEIEGAKLGVEQRKIAIEANKAHQLLLEDASSIALTESVGEMHADMERVSQRLSSAHIDAITIGNEEDIIATLNELIASLQQAQREQQERQKQEQQPPPMEGEEEDEPLVDQIAELKMIKAMQLRINERSRRLSKLLTEPADTIGQATERDLVDQIGQLGKRQAKLQQITRDIVLGKNK